MKAIIGIALLIAVALAACTGAGEPSLQASPQAFPQVTEFYPPCTPIEGSTEDPCELDRPMPTGAGNASFIIGTRPANYDEFLVSSVDFGLVPHIAVRGTYIPGTVRCVDGDEYFRDPPFLKKTSNLMDWTKTIYCFADIRVGAYLVGSGPSILPVMVAWEIYWHERPKDEVEEIRASLEAGVAGRAGYEWGDIKSNVTVIPGNEQIIFLRPAMDASIEAWHAMASMDVQRKEDDTVIVVHSERDFWKTYDPAIYNTYKTSLLELTLPAFTTAIQTANQNRITANGGRVMPTTSPRLAAGVTPPMIITNANNLDDYVEEIGADDHPDGPPMTPPSACGVAVTNRGSNSLLLQDCITLLDIKDRLRGTGTLNWAEGTAITSWDGVTVAGTPQRVTKLKLASKSLTGEVPSKLADLDALAELKLMGNTFTSCIPGVLFNIASNDLSSLSRCPDVPGGLVAGTVVENNIPLSWGAVTGASKYRLRHRTHIAGTWTEVEVAAPSVSHTVRRLLCLGDHSIPYRFTVAAFGDGTTRHASWSEPSEDILVETLPCVSPVFDEKSYSFTVPEDAGIGAAVGAVEATDPQSDTLTYSITAGNEDGKFSIGASTGAITVAGALDRETTETYTLTVQAGDGTNSATATVTVTVLQPNVAPVFDQESYSFPVLETAALFTVAGAVSATDSNPDDVLTFRVTAGDTASWNVDANEGWVVVRRKLDASAKASYNLTVEVRDKGGLTDTAAVEITVHEEPTDPPTAPTGLAAAAEEGDEVKVSWDALRGASQYRLQSRTGGASGTWTDLTATTDTSHTLTTQCGTAYDFRVQALGDGIIWTTAWGPVSSVASHTSTACPPAFEEESYAFSVAEDASVGAAVGTAAADFGGSGALSYSITAGDASGQFSIEASGAITVAAALDHEITASYSLTVQAAEPEGQSDTATVSITVTDVNETPSFDEDSYSFSIAEDAAVGASVGSASAADPDEDTLTYGITAGDADGQFSIDADGAITVAKALDFETTPSYTLTLTAEDPDGLSDTATVAVTVTDGNDPPAFDEDDYAFTVAEDAAVGAAVGSVSATDQDEDTPSYSITAGDASSQFSIDAAGAITVAKALDHETTASYTLTVEASDGNDGSDTTEVVVTVDNVNETPAFDKDEYAFRVAENIAVGATVGSASATDPDEDALTYSITAGDADSQFSIGAGGAISVAKSLDYETTRSYTLTVQAADPDGASDTATVTVTVRNVADTLSPAPGGLSISFGGGFVVSWDSVAGANNYRARYRESSGGWANLATTSNTTASLSPGGRPCGRTFDFAVQSHGNGRRHTAAWGPWSDAVEKAMDACPIHDRPWNLAAKATGTTVTLAWYAPTDGTVVTGYQVLRRIPGTESKLSILVENTESTDTTYMDSGLAANTRYVYRVKAVTADGLTPQSSSASATTGQ